MVLYSVGHRVRVGFGTIALVAGVVVGMGLTSPIRVQGQALGRADRGAPGDRQIQDYLTGEAEKLSSRFSEDLKSREGWEERRPELEAEFFHMLGLWPLPERTPLEATVTGTVEREDFTVELLHYQSVPGLYVTANLYRPAMQRAGQRFPAVLYVCGHSGRGRAGNKASFQSHGIWFARHGYVCLVVDSLQLGEIAALHHGTYREQRWWWHSRGYTPAGVEAWNGIRGIDYLMSRPDVDPDRLAVTGISGGGAATFWVAGGDPRVQVAVPVSGMADLPSYLTNRVINGHCDCMFFYNTFQWPWTRIAALLAPRPLLLVNSDQDAIFPMDANDRIINRLERMYSMFGAGDQVDALISIGGHAYREDIRQGVARFVNLHLRNDPRRVGDSEVDAVGENARDEEFPIPPEQLRVFAREEDYPRDQRNTTIDESFVPLGVFELPNSEEFTRWKESHLAQLRRVSFGALPERVPAAEPAASLDDVPTPGGPSEDSAGAALPLRETGEPEWIRTEADLRVRLERRASARGGNSTPPDENRRLVLLIADRSLEDYEISPSLTQQLRAEDRLFVLEPRGVGATRWTRNNPPNYVERSHVLLGRTVDTGRVWDIRAAARYLREQFSDVDALWVGGSGGTGLCAAYAGWWEEQIDGVLLDTPPTSHMESSAPQFLNILRVCDVPDALGLLAPKPLTLVGDFPEASQARVQAIYGAAGAEPAFQSLHRSE